MLPSGAETLREEVGRGTRHRKEERNRALHLYCGACFQTVVPGRPSMSKIQSCELPRIALLRAYRDRGAYTDCYVTEVAWPVSRPEYVEAFYTTAVFKLERQILKWFAATPSTDEEVRQLASGALDAFAAWRLEGQTSDQLLLRDVSGRTRSWLMVEPIERDKPSGSTRLYFGSAVVPVVSAGSGKATLRFTFRALLGFHKIYSRFLLHAARRRLNTRARAKK
jgi:hypothetical protein